MLSMSLIKHVFKIFYFLFLILNMYTPQHVLSIP